MLLILRIAFVEMPLDIRAFRAQTQLKVLNHLKLAIFAFHFVSDILLISMYNMHGSLFLLRF